MTKAQLLARKRKLEEQQRGIRRAIAAVPLSLPEYQFSLRLRRLEEEHEGLQQIINGVNRELWGVLIREAMADESLDTAAGVA